MRILNSETKNQLMQIFMLLDSFPGSQNFLVGGCVRDYLMGSQPKDFDIVTDTPMAELAKRFTEGGWGIQDSGQNFLVLIVSKNSAFYEIANFRKDGAYKDGRRPESVEIGTIDEDAARRDFTVNALYLNPGPTDAEDVILDPTGKGRVDLDKRLLRFVGKPEQRIREDFLRVFRFYRFLTKGFIADRKSLSACREFFNDAYKNTTAERVRNEIEKMVRV